jgi:hypothetical protein
MFKKYLFLFTLSVIVFGFWHQTKADKPKNEIKLTYLMNTSLKWQEQANEFLDSQSTQYTLNEEDSISLLTSYIENKTLYSEYVDKDKESIFKEIYAGKKLIHEMADYKNWTLTKNEKIVQNQTVTLIYEGSFFVDGKQKFFKEKHFITPYGLIFSSLDWTEKDKPALVKLARNDFDKIEFKVVRE